MSDDPYKQEKQYLRFAGASAAPDPTLLVDVLRLAQLAGAPHDPGLPATPEEVTNRATTYWSWIKEQQA